MYSGSESLVDSRPYTRRMGDLLPNTHIWELLRRASILIGDSSLSSCRSINRWQQSKYTWGRYGLFLRAETIIHLEGAGVAFIPSFPFPCRLGVYTLWEDWLVWMFRVCCWSSCFCISSTLDKRLLLCSYIFAMSYHNAAIWARSSSSVAVWNVDG